MASVIKNVGGGFSITDALTIALMKNVEERILTNYIGNGTIQSGAIKLGLGYASGRFLGKDKLGKSAGMALAIDGAEDILLSIIGGSMAFGQVEQRKGMVI